MTSPMTRTLGPPLAGVCLALALAMAPWAAHAQSADDELSLSEIAFIAADTNNDGVIDAAELARDAARAFATLDKNGDSKLTPEELGDHDPALFKQVDANGDGVLTFKEVMDNKIKAFKAGDKNNDGALTFDEMNAIVEAEIGGMK